MTKNEPPIPMMGPSYSGAYLGFGDGIVTKRGSGRVGKRLVEQHGLLQSWRSPIPNVRVPRSTLVRDGDDVCLELERIEGPGIVANCPNFEEHMDTLLALVRVELAEAILLPPDTGLKSLIVTKLEHVVAEAERQHGTNTVVTRAAEAVQAEIDVDHVPLPVGACHGDLTLCNVLCDCESGGKGAVVLIDRIQPYLISPVQDVIKLRQDTKHGWLRYHRPEVSSTRLAAMDDKLVEAFWSESWWRRWYRPLNLLSLLRIVPYTHAGTRMKWVLGELEEML